MAAPGHVQGPPGTMVIQSGMHPQQGTTVNSQQLHPAQHPHQNPQGNPPTQGPTPTHMQSDTDPINRFKNLLPRLKESLGNVFKDGGRLFYHNQDETSIQIDKRFEDSLEEFYTLCDHIEMQLRLAQEIFQQDTDSKTHTPMQVIPPKTDTGQPEGQLYSQYISTVRAQITCAKEIRDLLHDGLKLSSDHPHP